MRNRDQRPRQLRGIAIAHQQSNTVDCIDIDSPAVVLQLANNLSLSGPGGTAVTAVGTKIAKGADGLQLNIGNDTIEGFGIGIDEEASAVSISALDSDVMDNAAQGILVQGANSVLLESVNSEKTGARAWSYCTHRA